MPGPFWAPTLKGNDKTDGLKKPCVVPFCDLMWAMRATKALKKSKFSQPYPVLRWWCGRKTWSSVATSWMVWDRRRGFKKRSVASFLIVNYQFGWKKQWWKQWWKGWKGWKCCLGRRERSDQWKTVDEENDDDRQWRAEENEHEVGSSKHRQVNTRSKAKAEPLLCWDRSAQTMTFINSAFITDMFRNIRSHKDQKKKPKHDVFSASKVWSFPEPSTIKVQF